MEKTLGKTDCAILDGLMHNSRTPLTTLAVKARVSKQNVAYRVAQLKKSGAIQSFVALIDGEKAGYTTYYFNFRIKPISEHKERRIVKELLALGLLTLWRCEGEWNLIIGVAAEDVDALARQSLRIHYILRGLVVGVQWTVHLSTTTLARPLSAGESAGPAVTIGESKKREEIDDKDRAILSALSTGSRATYSEISQKAELPPETVRYRMRSLEKRKIIAGYTITLGTELEGFHHYRVFINLGIPTSERVQAVYAFLLGFRPVRRVVRMMSEFELMYDVRVSGERELRDIMQAVARRFHAILTEQTYVRITRDYRFSHFPPLHNNEGAKRTSDA